MTRKYNIEKEKPWKPKTVVKAEEVIKIINNKIKQEKDPNNRLVLANILEDIIKPLGCFWGYHAINGDDTMREYY